MGLSIVNTVSDPTMDEPMKDIATPLTHEQNQPALYGHLGQTHAIMAQLGYDPALSALVELRASQINQCAYCIDMHIAQARRHGVPQEKLDMLVAWRDVDHFSDAEKAALAWTEVLTKLENGADLSAARRDLQTHFSDSEISIITADIGMINLWNRVQKSKH